MQFAAAYQTNMLAHWDNVTSIRKPIIAAVNGFALGGGCVGFCERDMGFVAVVCSRMMVACFVSARTLIVLALCILENSLTFRTCFFHRLTTGPSTT